MLGLVCPTRKKARPQGLAFENLYCLMLTFFAVLPTRSKATLPSTRANRGVVGAAAHVLTGVDVRATLTNQNIAGQHELTVGALHAQALDSESRPFLVEPTPFYVPLCYTSVT